ncbi:MAG: hypothetical protein IPK69_06470 [Phycisphaerales bacterium]|nr:MAG: hypothetical protein IPK69_06470 [Phycisphaerales bacterium]
MEGFGELLTSRSKGPGQRLVLGIVGIVLGFTALGFVMTAIASSSAPSTPGGTPFTMGPRVVVFVLGCLGLWLSWLAMRGVLSRYHFFERGVTRTMLGRVVQAVEYERVAGLWYTVTRRYRNGIYMGTDVELVVEPLSVGGVKAKKISYSGRHKEKPDGVLSRTFLAKNFKGEDELDAIKNVIAGVIVERWMRSGEFREDWTGAAVLTPRGVEIVTGQRKGIVVPYSGVEGMSDDGEYLKVHMPALMAVPLGKFNPDFIMVQKRGRNCWAGIELVRAMQAAGESTPGVAETR